MYLCFDLYGIHHRVPRMYQVHFIKKSHMNWRQVPSTISPLCPYGLTLFPSGVLRSPLLCSGAHLLFILSYLFRTAFGKYLLSSGFVLQQSFWWFALKASCFLTILFWVFCCCHLFAFSPLKTFQSLTIWFANLLAVFFSL